MIKRVLYIDEQMRRQAGGSNCLFNFLTRLDRQKFLPILASPRGDLSAKCEAEGCRVFVVTFPKISKVSFRIAGLRLFNPLALFADIAKLWPLTKVLLGIIRKEKVDLLHTNSFTAHLAGFLAARISRRPIIWHMRDLAREQSIFIRLVGKKFVDRIIFMSEAIKESFTVGGASGRNMEVVYDGLDPDLYFPSGDDNKFRKRFNFSSSVRLIGIVGRLVPCKGHRYFLEAAREIANEIEEVKFLIVGGNLPESQEENSYREIKYSIEKLRLRDRVILTGFQSNVTEVMNALDVLVCPSLAESFGMVVLEALACGTPVVASNVGGIPEILQHGGGILVPPKDPESIAREVSRLLENPDERRRISIEGMKNVRENFPIERTVREIEGLYKEILGDCNTQ